MSPGRIKSATVVEKMRTYVDHVVGHVGGVETRVGVGRIGFSVTVRRNCALSLFLVVALSGSFH